MDKPEGIKRDSKTHKKLGDILLEGGLIDKRTLAKALEIKKTSTAKIGRILIDMGVADEEEIAKALAVQFRLPFLRLENREIPDEVISMVPRELAERLLAIPIEKTKKGLLVAMADPLEHNALGDLRFSTGMPIAIAIASHNEIVRAIEIHYSEKTSPENFNLEPGIDEALEVVQDEGSDEEDTKNFQDLLDLSEQAPVVRLANAIIADAIRLNASDIHIEPQENAVVIRYRVDGIMREVMRPKKMLHAPLVSRIKILSNMDISIRRKPQDGGFRVKFGDKNCDLRVSTLPTSFGEKATIRILNPVSAGLGVENLGFSKDTLQVFIEAISLPQGIILVTGPTGSGKSTTLYACLNKLNSPSVNIVSVEDPVEYNVSGINQVQIDTKSGMTFAAGLRSILRQDPDIVMVGEIRDPETASIAFQAAQTGHLVLSTLHTNDAPSAVTRLLDLGVDEFLVSSSLAAIVAQRLVRRICRECRIPDSPSPDMLKRIFPFIGGGKEITFWKGAGCEACQGTGYSGRLAVLELLRITPALRDVIVPGVSASILKKSAKKEGFQTMTMDGINKALQGITTIEEIFRVAPPDVAETGQATVEASGRSEAVQNGAPSQETSMVMAAAIGPPKILVVDDSRVILTTVGKILESDNYRVVKAENGLEALKLVPEEKPSLIVTDYLMPEMDGMTLIKKLKSQLPTRHIPIIMLTAKDSVDFEVKGIDAGADDYLAKPVNPKRLLARVGRLLKRSDMAQV